MAMLRQCEGIVVKVCLTLGGRNAEDQRDLYQDIVCALWEQWPAFRHESAPATWVTAVAVRVASLKYRISKRRPHLVAVDESFFTAMAAEAVTPTNEKLHHLVSLLRPVERTILILYLERIPLSDIARIEDLSTAAVKERLYRIKKKIRKLNDLYYED